MATGRLTTQERPTGRISPARTHTPFRFPEGPMSRVPEPVMQSKVPTPIDLKNLPEGPMSKIPTVISQAPKGRISLIRQIARKTPVIGESFERDVIEPAAKLGRFLVPSVQDSMREALEEDPTRSVAQLKVRARELQDQNLQFGSRDGLPGFDPSGALGTIGTTAFKEISERLAKLTKRSQVAKEIDRIAPQLVGQPTVRDQLIANIAREKNPQLIERAISGIAQVEVGATGRIAPERARPNIKLQQMAQSSGTFEEFVQRSGITEEALETTTRQQGSATAKEYFEKNKTAARVPAEEVASLERTAGEPAPRTPAQLQEETQRLISEKKLPAEARTPFDTEDVIRARNDARAAQQTWAIQTPERQTLRTQIIDDLYGKGAMKKERRLDIVMGPPGAGKSSVLVEPLAKEHGALLADSDIVKEKLPEYQGGKGAMAVHEESSKLNAEMLYRALDAGDNVVFPTVGKSIESLQKLISRAEKAGYAVHVHLNDLPPEKAVERVLTRFKETGRFVDPDYVLNEVGLSPAENFDIIKAHGGIKGYTKYSNDVAKGERPILIEDSVGDVRRSADNRGRDGGNGQGEGSQVDRVTEEDSLDLAAEQQDGSEFVLKTSVNQEERIVSNLEAVFADLKGVEISDLKVRFSDARLERAELEYQFAMESIIDDPARALAKYVSKATGRLPEITGKPTRESLKGGKKRIVKNSEYGIRGDDINQSIFGSESDFRPDPEYAQQKLDAYLERKKRVSDLLIELREIRHNMRLAKQKDAFVGKEKNRLARQVATNLRGLRAIVEAAERAGFKRGAAAGNQKYAAMVNRLKTRRSKINAIKKVFNLTDTEMRKVRGLADPRFMDAAEFDTYLKEVEQRAEAQFRKNEERILIDAIIKERDLKKVENLQRALEFPPVKNMSVEQLIEFGNILAATRHGDTFLGPRMIQTAANTDLGSIRTMQDGIDAVLKQTGMKYADPVVGSKMDRWMRDPTLVEKDPLHKTFITEWVAKEADMMTRQYALRDKLNMLAKASRRSRKRGIFARMAPQDNLPVQYAQTIPEELHIMAKRMTKEELEYGEFLRGFFQKYYKLVQEDASDRWTLRGVKNSRFEDMYFPHMTRGFFERWKDDGFIRAMKILWSKNVEDARSVVDYGAFGDRGEILGYEKWFKNNMKREGESAYTKNSASTTLAYFHAFERKLLLDSMIPKIKLLEFLMGKRFQTPKSITNPEGTEQVHSQLRKHINEWINNKKGQRIQMVYEQGDRAEAVVDAARLFIATQHLGANIFAQVASGVGGEAATFAGVGIRGWATGHKRALTEQGRKLGREHAGVIGDTPWNDLASAANDVGDTLRGGLFYIFGDLAYRARRQMFLGLLTKEEFASGVISSKRAAEIKLQIGKWHPMPEFRSVAGSTSAVKTAAMYTEWATPILQNTAFTLLPRLSNMARSTEPGKWRALASSDEFQTLFRTTIGSAGLAAAAYLVLNPDENDRSNLGYMRNKAAQEIGTIIQAMTTMGIPIPGSVFIGYMEQLRAAVWTMAKFEEYKTAGPGHAEGDLKGPTALGRVLIPRGIQQWFPQPETPLKTEDDIRKELIENLESGELSRDAAKVWLAKELKNLESARKKRRLEMSKDEYREDLRTRLQAGDIDYDTAREEIAEYLEEQKKYAPESFESKSDAGFIEKIQISAKALGTDPVTLFQAIFTGEEIRRMDNGEIILHRGKTSDPLKQKEFSLDERKERDATAALILDHTIPLQLGGDNSDRNLQLVPREDWEQFTPVENYLGQALRSESINARKAQQLIRDYKAGELTEQEVYAAVE